MTEGVRDMQCMTRGSDGEGSQGITLLAIWVWEPQGKTIYREISDSGIL